MNTKQFIYALPFIVTAIVYGFALRIPVMDIDAGQYSALAYYVYKGNNWLHFYEGSAPYLDKPPLLFWLSALSYKAFGVSYAAYKLPSLVAWLFGIYAIYRFALLWYDQKIAYHSALVAATSLAGFMMVNDVRTDTLLTAAIAVALWQLSEWVQAVQFGDNRRRWRALFGASAAITAAMLAKGPIGAVVPLAAVGGHLLFTQKAKLILEIDVLVAIALVLVGLSPMLYGLYTQYDLHPELLVNGERGVSGVKFYFWTQSFGRITGENKWANKTDPFFFVHTLIWTFLPWGLFIYFALYQRVRQYLSTRKGELISVIGVLFPLVALSFSHYKLPHYIYVALPSGSILVAWFLVSWRRGAFSAVFTRGVAVLSFIAAVVMVLAGAALVYLDFPSRFILLIATLLLAIIGLLEYFSFILYKRVFIQLIIGILFVNLILALHLYPKLLRYQSATTAGEYVRQLHLQVPFYSDGWETAAFTVAYQQTAPILFNIERIDSVFATLPKAYLLTSDYHIAELRAKNYTVTPVKTFYEYPITHLSRAFMNPATRQSVLTRRELVCVEKKR